MSTIVDANKSLSDNYIISVKVYDMEDVRIGNYIVDGGFFSTAGCSQKIEKKLADRTFEAPICFLNGGIMEVSLEEDLKDHIQLRSNLSMSKDIIRYTQKTIMYSANYMQRSFVFRAWQHCIQGLDSEAKGVDEIGYFSMEKLIEANCQRQILKKAYGVSDEISLNKEMLLSIGLAVFSNRLEVKNLIENAEENSCGNCLEMGLIGWKYAKDKFPEENTEIFEINQGDHVFLVIGRNLDSDPADYKSWGCDAVVCDPWSGGCYPASQIENFLMDFSQECQLSGVTIPCVTAFDPSYQSLNLVSM